MTLAELIAAVEAIIQDTSFTEANFIEYLNQAQQEIAGGMQSVLGDWLTPPLPNLFTIDTVETATDAAYVAMPATFQRSLQFVSSSQGTEIDLAESFISFAETYPLLDKSGTLTECIEFGNNFYYQGIPTTAEDVTLHFYRFPVDMAEEADTPDGIPSHLHKSLLVNHACWKIYELIEDDMTEIGANTQKYMDRFYMALKLLEMTIPYENRIINLIKD